MSRSACGSLLGKDENLFLTLQLLYRLAMNTLGSTVSTGLAFTPVLHATPIVEGMLLVLVLSHVPLMWKVPRSGPYSAPA